ncbi:hypothetical protein LCGC14_1976090 [marine sediment metagenome]|uniref:Polysaccharide biosynthesis protein C-terminal domain-containing protein n=1 Tax=marine sediment metagenome TaxID=412755 RepID=A0A0F9FYI8_9ZZZZ
MSPNNNQNKRKELSKENKILAKNSFYSFIHSYGNFFFSLITASIIARVISQSDWGYLILTLSLIGFFTIILAFLPPSLGISTVYYVSQFKALNQNTKLRSFTRNTILLRLLFLIPIFFLSILIFTIFGQFFKVNLKDYYYLFYLLAPMIIIDGLYKNFLDLARALNMFKVPLFLLILKNTIYIGGLLYLFFYVDPIQVSFLAIILIISSATPFIIIILILFVKLQLKIKKTEEDGISFSECIKILYKYGSYMSTADIMGTIEKESKTQLVGLYEVAEAVAGYHIAYQYIGVSRAAISPLNRPLIISFTRLYNKKQLNQIQKIYKTLFNYFLFITLIITGILFFVVDIILYIIYGESYLVFSIILKLLLIANIFTLQAPFFGAYTNATNKIKYIPISFNEKDPCSRYFA